MNMSPTYIEKINFFCSRVLKKLSRLLQRLADLFDGGKGDPAIPTAILDWVAVQGDTTLRLTYDLTKDSIVYDIGGYCGQWASDIFSKYLPTIYIFEPMLEFYAKIESRFKSNSNIKPFPFGLASYTGETFLSVAGDASSLLVQKNQASTRVHLANIVEFIIKQHHENIDLMKINVEGAEYDILPALIKSGLIVRIKNLQLQFHDTAPDSRKNMETIQSLLSKTHRLTWHYEFVWENWERIE